MLLLLIVSHIGYAQENITVVTPSTEVAEGLDLYAVAEIFKDSDNLEEFERALNDPDLGINNLDLDRDGYVDYIRVVEEVNDYTHVIILQVPLGHDEFQDVATIEIEKTGYDNYNMQVRGNEVIYGVDYYVAPVYVRIHHWPIITWIYRPFYRPYWSVFYFGYYPHWWKPYRPVTVHVYHIHTARYSRRATFHITRENQVQTVHKVGYKLHTSPGVERNAKNSHPDPVPERNMRMTTPQPERKSVTMKRDVEEASPDRSNRISDREDRRSTYPAVKKNTPTWDDAGKTMRPEVKRSTPVQRDSRRVTRSDAKQDTPIRDNAEKTTKQDVKRTKPSRSDAGKITRPNVERSTPVKSEVKRASKPDVEKKATIKSSDKKAVAQKKNSQ